MRPTRPDCLIADALLGLPPDGDFRRQRRQLKSVCTAWLASIAYRRPSISYNAFMAVGNASLAIVIVEARPSERSTAPRMAAEGTASA